MSGSFPTDMPEWMREVNRRVDLLERRRQHRGTTTTAPPGGGGGIGKALTVTFVSGVAGIPNPVPNATAVVAGFAFHANVEAPVSASISGSTLELRAPVSDATYPVQVIFATG